MTSSRTSSAAPTSENAGLPEPGGGSGLTNLLAKIWMGWFVVYMSSWGLFPEFLPGTLDRVESSVVSFVFLDIPLQLGLVFIAVIVGRAPSRLFRRAGVALCGAALILAAAHVAISAATWSW